MRWDIYNRSHCTVFYSHAIPLAHPLYKAAKPRPDVKRTPLLAHSLPDPAAMPRTYYVHATRHTERKVVRCSAAWIAIEQYDRLSRQGWKVSVHDASGDPIADDDLAQAMLAEARAPKGI
ncbi:hypothetical protein ACFZ8E_26680 [Methylobacterium sp. HMF5984]|uniref:hypothetical protein n=1 Tax=Methylobacterium sp. HMF5984 TaxID=3367370 RepID=UPI003853EF0D